MTTYAFPFASPPAVPIADGDAMFPVRRIYCVGRNYAAHAREMGSDPERELPFFFCKPADAVLPVLPGQMGAFPYPPATHNCHYEAELVVAVGQGGSDIPVASAWRHVFGYAVGLDMTRRDLQNEAKQAGRPWDTSKAFDHAAPIAPILPVGHCGHLQQGPIWLKLNGQQKQRGDLAEMIWSVPEIIAHLSGLFRLEPGDLIFTGTPEGVGPVKVGDVMSAGIAGLGELQVRVV